MNSRRPYPLTTKNVAFLFFLVTPGINAGGILKVWPTHPVLKDYIQPDQEVLTIWTEEFISFRNSFLYSKEYRHSGGKEARHTV